MLYHRRMDARSPTRTAPGQPATPSPEPGRAGVARAVPLVFVVIWATGFVVARLVAAHAQPLWFLEARFVLTVAALLAICVGVRATWPRGVRTWLAMLGTGMLMQGVFLGGVFWATHQGLSASVAALITGLQPLATAALAGPLLGERVSGVRWAGIATGFVGAMLVIGPTLAVGAGAIGGLPVLACLASMLSITLGTLIQKRAPVGADLRTTACVQFMGATLLVLPLAALTEPPRFDPGWQLWVGLAWAVGALSVGASLLLLGLIRRGGVAGVASLFYLVPPVVAVMAFALFGDRLVPVQVAGMLVAALGVFVASRG